MKSIINNKRGQQPMNEWFSLKRVIIGIVLIVGLVILLAVIPETQGKLVGWLGGSNSAMAIVDFLQGVGKYFLGVDVGTYQTGVTNIEKTHVDFIGLIPLSGYVIIVIMIWLIIFNAFSDIFTAFGPFGETTGVLIAFAFATIIALSGGLTKILVWLTSLFAFTGAIMVYIGLIAAFVCFLGMGWGSATITKWAIKRKVMAKAYRASGVALSAAQAKAIDNKYLNMLGGRGARHTP